MFSRPLGTHMRGSVVLRRVTPPFQSQWAPLHLKQSQLFRFTPLPAIGQIRDISHNNRQRRRIPPPSSSSGQPTDRSKWVSRATTAGLAGSVLFGKGKYVFAGLKMMKATPLLSMIFTSFTYSLFFGWPYAVGMVGQIAFHEMGHLVVLRHYGVPFSPMVMIPFMGASIQMQKHPRNAYEEAMIAFGGPIAGGAAAGGLALLAASQDSQLLYSLADFGFMINLFNCLPIYPLDGGRIANAISPYLSGAGLLAGGAMAYSGAIGNPIFYLVLLAGGYDAVSRVLGWSDRPRGYERMSRARQAMLFVGLVGLIGSLLLGMRLNDRKRKTPKQLQREKDYGGIYHEPAPWDTANEGAKFDDFFDDRGPRSGRF